MIGRTNAGGGASLNFKVVGGTSTPASSKENTIWVNTDVKITSWIFSASEPEQATQGMVWFPTGASSPSAFNALKKNGITVYPLSAKQHVGGAWVDKTAKSYRNGAWVGWVHKLYENGNEFTDLSGGWTLCNDIIATASKEASYITIAGTTSGGMTGRRASAYANNEIDLTPFNKIIVTVETWNPGAQYNDPFGQLIIGYATNESAFTTYSYDSIMGKTITSVIGKTTYEIDVSSVNTSVYIGASIKNCGTHLYLFELA